MKVVSKLVKMDFAVGTIERKEQYIIITSDPDRSTIETKVRLSPEDAWDMIKAGLNWPTISYLLSLPFLIRKSKQAAQKKRLSEVLCGWLGMNSQPDMGNVMNHV